ncbi:MAG TPA: patatin-like phospholipase family protein [Blastocatellia bacterium]|nr:patatin-like phospholipase family protein [Blastocatellia bacterium]
MPVSLSDLRSLKVGLALSGGAVRGLAHVGALKVLNEAGIYPSVVAGTSVGSLLGAAIAAGKTTDELTEMARKVFWPSFLNARHIERFCRAELPATFAALKIPFAAVATEVPSMKQVVMTEGDLASAISASCAVPIIRFPVKREQSRLLDGGLVCIVPASICRAMGADYVISSDVWEYTQFLRNRHLDPINGIHAGLYPSNYRRAMADTDLLITPSIPAYCYIPGQRATDKLLEVGEAAARQALTSEYSL